MKPKTLGELLDADKDKTGWLDVLHWLERNGIYDAVPLIISGIGEARVRRGDNGCSPLVVMCDEEAPRGEPCMTDITGRTVALLAESVQVPGIAPKSASD